MTKIKEIMSANCQWGARDMSVSEAAQLMKQNDFGFLPVGCTQQDKLVGAITDRDIVLRAVAEGKAADSLTISDIMTDKVYYCYDDQDVKDVCDNMGEVRVRRLPVMNRDKRLVGVVSFGDVAQAAVDSEIGQTQKKMTRECAQNVCNAA